MYLNVTYMYLYVLICISKCCLSPSCLEFFFFLFSLISATITTLYISATITSTFRNELQITKRKANRKSVFIIIIIIINCTLPLLLKRSKRVLFWSGMPLLYLS